MLFCQRCNRIHIILNFICFLRNKEESTSEAKRTKAPVKNPAQQKPIDDDDFDWGAPEKKVDSKQKQDTSAQKP